MRRLIHRFKAGLVAATLGAAMAAAPCQETAGAAAARTRLDTSPQPVAVTPMGTLASTLAVGDVVFIRVGARPFREVAAATGSWTNHVGVVVDTAGDEPLIGESTFPVSRTTTLSRFVARSEDHRVAVGRLAAPLTGEQAQRLTQAVQARAGIFYDTGFDLHSRRQFCSRYVREVLAEATGVALGEVETFGSLFAQQPQANVGFWKLWYLGRIPWDRETVTPASLLRSHELSPVFDGVAVLATAR